MRLARQMGPAPANAFESSTANEGVLAPELAEASSPDISAPTGSRSAENPICREHSRRTAPRYSDA